MNRIQLREFTSWLGKRSYRTRLQRLGIVRSHAAYCRAHAEHLQCGAPLPSGTSSWGSYCATLTRPALRPIRPTARLRELRRDIQQGIAGAAASLETVQALG